MIQNSFELFEEVSAYSIIRSEKQCLESELFPQLGFIIDGISDFQLFTNQIQEKISDKLKIIKIFDRLAFISFKSDINYFNEQIKPELLISHYNIRSIFLKNDSLSTILAKFSNINEKDFYLYYYSDFQSHTKYYSPKAEEVKISSSNPKKYLYRFANFSDLIESYADLVGKIWPVFAIYPSKVKKGQIHIQKEILKNINFSTKFKSFYPAFSPLKFLYYLCFVEKNPPKPERKLNVSEFYSINKIRDVQISHLYSDSTIRTFLGFDTKFRCFLVLDYLIHSNEDNQLIFDFKFVNEPNFSIQNSINSNLYYLELRSVFDSSILFSINFKESFNFFNDSDNSSSFLCFENQKDFLAAKQLFSASLDNDFLFKNMRIIENSDFSILIKNLQLQSDLFYIMFQLKVLNKKQKLPNFTALFKGSKIIRKDCICTLDNKSYIIVGFINFQRRNEAFQNLKRSKFLITLKSYLSEKMGKKKNNSNISQKQNKNDEIKPKIDEHLIQPKVPLFHPKEGLFYIYFQEFQKSKLNYPSNVVRPLFGLQNIVDLQRNYYLPDDTIEYTFVGFEKLEHLQKVIKDSSSKTNTLVTNILNNRIFDYQNRQEIILKVNQNNDYENRFSYHVEDNKNDPFSKDTKLKNSSDLNKNDNNSDMASEKNITSNNNNGFTNKNQTKIVDTDKNNNNFDNNGNNKENNVNTIDIDNFNNNNNKTNQTNINHSNDMNNDIKNDNNNTNSIPNNESNKGSNSTIERDTKTEIESKPVNKSGKNIKNSKKKIESKNDDNQNDENIILNKFQNADTTKYIIDLKKYKKVASSMIGSGTYGSVYLVENINTHKKYAAKVKRDQKYDDFIQEIKFYTTFQNPLILSLHGYSKTDFDNKPKLTLILEYMPNNSLEDFLNKTPKFINSVKSKKYIILFGIISALAYLHSKCVVHRDLKPSNILLDSNYYPRICDFGSSIMYQDFEQRIKKNEKNVGTPLYMAPEIFIDKEPYSFKVDIYSFALIAYQLLTEKQPYYDQKFKSINHFKKCVLDGLRPDLSIIPDDEICAFFSRCWSSEPSERPTAKELYDILQTNKFKRIYQCDVNEMVQFLSWCGNNNFENQKLSTVELRKSHLKGDERSSIIYANILFGGGSSR